MVKWLKGSLLTMFTRFSIGMLLAIAGYPVYTWQFYVPLSIWAGRK